MQEMLNHMRRVAQEASSSQAVTRHGLVDGYDPTNYAIRVRLQPDDTLTDWIPLKSVAVGNGWGFFWAPSIGDAIEIDFQEADGEAGSGGWRFFNDADRPLPVPAGEMWMVHQSGASFKLTSDGAATFDSGAGASVQVKGDTITSVGTWSHTGTIEATGDITGNGTSLHNHKHGGVQTGSGQSGTPV